MLATDDKSGLRERKIGLSNKKQTDVFTTYQCL